MNKAFQPLLELERRTKAGEIAPLVAPPPPPFWPSPTHARRFAISKAQLELRQQKGLPADARVANVAALLGDGLSWLTCGGLFAHLTAEDSWPMVVALVEDELDFGFVHFAEQVEWKIGKLTAEEWKGLAAFQTIGELADCLEKFAAEGREKVPPPNPNLWRERLIWLFGVLLAFGLLWPIGRLLARLLHIQGG